MSDADLLAACKAARAYGSQGDTDDGISVSYLLDEAIRKAEVVSQCGGKVPPIDPAKVAALLERQRLEVAAQLERLREAGKVSQATMRQVIGPGLRR